MSKKEVVCIADTTIKRRSFVIHGIGSRDSVIPKHEWFVLFLGRGPMFPKRKRRSISRWIITPDVMLCLESILSFAAFDFTRKELTAKANSTKNIEGAKAFMICGYFMRKVARPVCFCLKPKRRFLKCLFGL